MTAILGALLLALALALPGCSQNNTASTDATEKTEETTETTEATEEAAEKTEEATDDAAATDEAATDEAEADFTLNDDVTKATGVARDLIINGEPEGSSEKFGSLPTGVLDDMQEISGGEALEEGDEDKEAGSNSKYTIISEGGIYMGILKTWKTKYVAGSGWEFSNSTGMTQGLMMAEAKESGKKYDVESLAKAIPDALEKEGFSDFEIVGTDELTSTTSNKKVGYQLLYACSYEGEDMFQCVEVIESKSHINAIYVVGEMDDFTESAKDLDTMFATVSYRAGHAI